MAVDEKMVARAAKLARIGLTSDEQAALVPELNNIFDWVSKLQDVDVEGVEQTISVVQSAPAWRDDNVTADNLQDVLMQNAPASAHGFFAVPKVVE